MKYITTILLLVMYVFTGCTKTELNINSQEEIIEDVKSEQSLCSPSTLCIPPFTIDTNCVQMQMKIDGILYSPVANFTCILPNFLLGDDQLWINGSLILAKKVITLRMPPNVQPGEYEIIPNTDFDAFYVPTIDADNFIGASGTLRIIEHDTIENYILGGFDFIAENLDSPVLPVREFTKGCFEAYY